MDADAGGITLHPATIFTADVAGDAFAMAMLASDTVVLAYADFNQSSRMEAIVATIAGTDITLGNPTTIDASASNDPTLVRVGDACVLLWTSGTPLTAWLSKLTVSAGAVSASAPVYAARPPDAGRGRNKIIGQPWAAVRVGELAWGVFDWYDMPSLVRLSPGAEAEVSDPNALAPDVGPAWKYAADTTYDSQAMGDAVMVEMADGKLVSIANRGSNAHAYLSVAQLEGRLGVWRNPTGDPDPLYWLSSTAFLQNGQAHMAKLTDTELVLVYRDNDAGGAAKARIATISGFFDVAYGPEFPFVLSHDRPRVAALDSTTFVVAYVDASDNKTTVQLGKVSGTDITFVNEVEANAGPTQSNSVGVTAVGPTTFALAWTESGVGYVAAGEVVAGAFLSVGTPAVLGACPYSLHKSIAAPDAAHAVLVYSDGSDVGYAQAVGISGTTATVGTRVEVCANMGATPAVSALPGGRAVVVYKDRSLGGNPANPSDPLHEVRVRGLLFSGTNIAPMTPATLARGPVSPHTQPGCEVGWALGLDWERAAVSYKDGNTGGAFGSSFTHDMRIAALHDHGLSNDPPAWGPPAEFAENVWADNASLVRVAVLSPTTAVVTYIDDDYDYGYARVVTVDPDTATATFGPAKAFYTAGGAGATQYLAAWAVDSSRFLACWLDHDVPRLYAKVGTVSGTDITFGSQSTVRDGMVYWPVCEKISSAKLIVAYRDVADSGHGTAKVATIDGTSVTFGPECEFQPAGEANQLSFGLAVLDSTTAVIAYVDGPSGNHGVAKVVSVNGTDITYGAAATFNATFVNWVAAVRLDSARFLVAYNYGGGDYATVRARVGTAAGLEATYGPEATLTTAFGGHLEMTPVSPTAAVAVWSTIVDGGLPTQQKGGESKTLGVAGTTIVPGAVSTFQALGTPAPSEGPLNNGPATLDPANVVVAWRDEQDGNKGKLRVGRLDSTYPSAVGATRLAFAAWTREAFPPVPTTTTTTAPPPPAAGPEHELPVTDGADVQGVAALTADTFVVLYKRDFSSSTYYNVVVGTVSGTDITFGPATTTVSGSSSLVQLKYGSIAALGSTRVVVAYNYWSSGVETSRVQVGELSGAAIVFGAAHAVPMSGAGWSVSQFGVACPDAATAVLTYKNVMESNPRAIAAFISGTVVISWTAEADLGGTGTSIDWTRATVLDSSSVLCTFMESTGPTSLYLRARTAFVVGGTVTLGSLASSPTVNPNRPNSAVSRLGASSKFLFAAAHSGDGRYTMVIDAADPVTLTIHSFSPAYPDNATGTVAAAGINSGEAIVGYQPTVSGARLVFRVAGVVGSDATYGAEWDLDPAATPACDNMETARLDDATAVFVYENFSGGNLLRARVVSA